MVPSLPCLSPQEVESFLLGRLPDWHLEVVAYHLEQCAACQGRVEAAQARDPLMQDVRGGGDPATLQTPPQILNLIDRLQRLDDEPAPPLVNVPDAVSQGGSATPPLEGAGRAAEGQPEPPAVLQGRYRIVRRLGVGGMGTVYLASDEQLQRQVAVKVPRRAGSWGEEVARQRFLREVRSAARVSHPHVCTVHDAGEDQGVAFIVMEYIDGRPLAEELEQLGRYEDPRRAAGLLLPVARALQAVHDQGIIHRDLKPANILVARTGTPFLTDFGLAQWEVSAEQLTVEGFTVGTPAYVSPEQVTAGAAVDRRADLYSLGLILYRMVTGRLPFEGTPGQQVWQRISQDVPAASSLRPGLDAGLDAILHKALARRPDDRYGSAAAFADDLEAWLGGPGRAPAASPRPRPPQAGRWAWVLLGLATTLLGGAALYVRSREFGTTGQPVLSPLPGPAAADRPLRTFHVGWANRAAFSPTDRWVALSTPADAVRLLDPATGAELHRLEGHGPCELWGLAFSADGQRLLTGGDDYQACLWNATTHRIEQWFKGHTNAVKRVAFTPDPRRVVTASDDGTVRLWDTATGKEVGRFPFDVNDSTIHALSFSADGRWLLNGCRDGSLELFDVAARARRERWRAHDGEVSAVALSPDGKRALSADARKRLRLWDLERSQPLADLDGHDQTPILATFLPGGRQAVSSDFTGDLYFWDLDTRQLTRRLKYHRYKLSSLVVSPSGQELLSLSGHGELVLWRLPP